MLLFIPGSRVQTLPFPCIQIHLMLLFILIPTNRAGSASVHSNTSHVIVYRIRKSTASRWISNSNTSHVIVYRRRILLEEPQEAIQIHLMLLFIEDVYFWKNPIKYISCYCLSKTYTSGRTPGSNSNTSHVIVYRKSEEK